jgi:CRP/FNR family transcriptional regulator
MAQRFTYLNDIPLFQGCAEPEIERLAEGAYRRQVPRQGIIQFAGQPTTAFAVLARGQAKAVLYREDGRETLIRLYEPGDFLGENALFGLGECPYAVVAARRCEFVFLRPDAVGALLRSNPEFALRMLVAVSQALFGLQRRLRDVLHQRADRRILAYFEQLVAQGGVPTEDGVLYAGRLSQQVIANACGLARETVSRVLGQLRKQGVLRKTAQGWLLRQNPGTALP